MADEDFTTRFGRAMRRVSIHIIAVALIAGVGAWWFGRSVLRGDTSHNFGTVEIGAQPVKLQHVFSLVNRTSKSVEIKSLRPDCGCTTAAPDRTHVDPGATVTIDVSLEISRHGEKASLIALDLGDAGVQMLKVRATGNMRPRLSSPVEQVEFTRDAQTGAIKPEVLQVYANVFGTLDPPPGLGLGVPVGVRATFGGWTLRREPRNPATASAEWEGVIRVVPEAMELSADAALLIDFAGVVDRSVIPMRVAAASSMPANAATRRGEPAD